MRPVLLIAGNFFREQRILLALMVAYVVLGGGTLALLPHAPEIEDVIFLIKQHAAYAVLLGVALASTAIHNERKSKRILAVLSKGITRGQYLAGMLLGSVSVLLGYLFCLGIIRSDCDAARCGDHYFLFDIRAPVGGTAADAHHYCGADISGGCAAEGIGGMESQRGHVLE